jgi:hypothetical protein
MKIYNSSGIEIYDITVDDNSYSYRALLEISTLTLYFSSPDFIDIPLGSYCEFQGENFYLEDPANFKKHGTRNFEYTLILEGVWSRSRRYKLKNIADGRLKFSLTAKPDDHLQLIVDNMNLRDAGWSVGDCIDAPEKTINYNHIYCKDALQTIADEFQTEWEIVGKVIHLRKIEYYKDAPLTLSYGKGNGFKTGVGRTNLNDSRPVEVLYVQGGERNIDYSKYGAKELLLPKSQQLVYQGRTYQTDAAGLSIRRADKPVQFNNEDSLDLSHIYPSRIGTVSSVIVVDADKHFYDFIDSSIPVDLNYNDCRIAGEKATIIFQTGMLAGREFEIEQTDTALTGYIHAERRFKLVPQEMDGVTMPNDTFKPAVGDKYTVFGISLPDAYVCNNATKVGASWDMFREGAKYLYENEDLKFSFTGEVDGIWAKQNWLAIGGKIKPGSFVSFSDTQFQPEGILIRQTSVKQFVNNPYSPVVELSNAPAPGGLGSTLKKIGSNEVVVERLNKEAIRYAKRGFRDSKQTAEMLAKAMTYYGKAINPVAIQTMSLMIGDESLQFRFVDDMLTPVTVAHNVQFNPATKVLNSPAGIIQHMTLGIDSISSSHAVSEYKFWNMAMYNSPALDQVDKSYYLYAKVSKTAQTGVFLLSESPIGMEDIAGYYHLLVGILNAENEEGDRSYVDLYGYSEFLPGRITTSKIVSPDGNIVIDLSAGTCELQGVFNFSAGSSGYENLTDKPNTVEFSDFFNKTIEVFNARWEKLDGSGELSIVDDANATGGKYLRIGNNSGNDKAWIIGKNSIPYDPSRLYQIRFRIRRTTGTGTVYLGIAGRDYSDAAWVNSTGANSWSSQHYIVLASGNPSSSWTEYIGYFKGNGAYFPNASSPLNPSPLHANVRFFRPLILANYDALPGVVEVDYCKISIADEVAELAILNNSVAAVQDEIDDANAAVNSLNTYVDGAFKDGVINNAEAVAIQKYINTVTTEQSDLDAAYAVIFANSYLEGTPKTTLLNAKITYDGAATDLINAINTAIADNSVTTTEKNTVNSAFTTYRNALSSLKTAIEHANKAIQAKLDALSTEKVTNVKVGARNYYSVAKLKLDKYDMGGSHWRLQFTLAPNTQYTIQTTIPRPSQDLMDCWAGIEDNPIFVESSAVNGVAEDAPRILTTGATGNLIVSFRKTHYDSVIDGTYKIWVTKGNKPTDWTLPPEDVDEKINNIQVGGRNYIRNSKLVTHSGIGLYPFVSADLNAAGLQDGDEVTLSFKVSANSNYELIIYTHSDTTINWQSPPQEYRTERKRIQITSTETKVVVTYIHKVLEPYVILYKNTTESRTTTIKEIQLEKGNKATDYTEDPLDTEDKIENINTTPRNLVRGDIYDNSIAGYDKTKALKLWPNYGMDGKVMRINLTENPLKQAGWLSYSFWFKVASYVANQTITVRINDHTIQTIAVTAATGWVKYSGKINVTNLIGSNGFIEFETTVGGFPVQILISDLIIVKGEIIPKEWILSYEEIQEAINLAKAEAEASAYLKEALANDTTVNGGLLSTSLIKVGAVNSAGQWIEKAGINGAGTGDSVPRLYTGGSLTQAQLRVLNNIADLANWAKIVFTEGGTFYGMDVELFGSIATAPTGARIRLDQASGSILIYDSSNNLKLSISRGNIPSLASLLAGNSDTKTVNLSVQSSGINDSDSADSVAINLPVGSDNYTIVTPAINYVLNASITPDTHAPAYAQVIARMVHPDGSVSALGSLSVNANDVSPTVQSSGTITSKQFSGMPSGLYKIRLITSVSSGNQTASSYASLTITNQPFSGESLVAVNKIYQNGMFMIQDATNLTYISPTHFEDRKGTSIVRHSATEQKFGILAAARISSGGGVTNVVGDIGTASTPTNGLFTITHGLGHVNYIAIATAVGSGDYTAAVVTQTSTQVTVQTRSGSSAAAQAFNIALIGV